MSPMPLIILRTCIMSLLCLLCHKEGKSKYSNRWVYVMCLVSINNLVALPCTLSTEIDWYLYLGYQITLAYSKWGLIKDIYNNRNVFLFKNRKVRFNIPNILVALCVISYIWWSKFNLGSKVTPRSTYICKYLCEYASKLITTVVWVFNVKHTYPTKYILAFLFDMLQLSQSLLFILPGNLFNFTL